jgi:hypothetical protein
MAQFMFKVNGTINYKQKSIPMSGRGDNNKNGSSGRGASNQSMQGMKGGSHEKAAHGKQTGGQRSQAKGKQRDQSSHRNSALGGDEK